MVELLPNRDQARKLVVSLAFFWAAWAIAVIGFDSSPPVGGVAVVVGLVAGFRFYLTLYGVWEPESGVSAWRMMFVPSLSRSRRRASLHIFDLLRPSWIQHTLRATGWPPKVIGSGLLALLLADLLVAIAVFPSLANR
jgi:hypothetical protein